MNIDFSNLDFSKLSTDEYMLLGGVVGLLLMSASMFFVLRKGKTAEIQKQLADELEAQEARQAQAESASEPAAAEPAIEPAAVESVEAQPEPENQLAVEEPAFEEAPEEPAVEVVAPAEPVEPVALDRALEKTRTGFLGRIKGIFSGGKLEDEDFEELEEVLYTSDLGPKTVERLMEAMEERLPRDQRGDYEKVRGALKDEVLDIFSPFQETDPFDGWKKPADSPLILMVVGVNGAGKTTTIGKLSRAFSARNQKVMIAAGDTFRAAAGDQLKVWSERAEVEIFFPDGVTDPSAVAYDACQSAQAKGFDVLIIDTAGRLHTQSNLMEELKKMKRVVSKNIEAAPHEVLLVLDANQGQNALIQAKNFHEALDVSGVVLTKLDGSAKGGVAVGVACELEIPIKLIGVGEGIEDLRPFSSAEFVDSIL